ncbi:MAG TPA: type II toxin-antitoxin system RelE/ParE family toxin [Defluviicoccus sp.]|nr:type II toxin-antitoxin system RelE/ParE family toxin [Defluviicoccus sp.]
MAGEPPWPVRLTAAAEADFRSIVRWICERFGEAQARAYADTLVSAITALAQGPAIPGAKARNDINSGLFTLHVARGGRRGRHFLMFRIGHDGDRDLVEVLRILHDAMDVPRHMPKKPRTEGGS